jgi:hypothetical protein
VTAKSGHNAAGFRKLQKLALFVTASFYITKCDSTKAVTIEVTMKTVIESFKSPFLSGSFVTICDLDYFYTSLAYSTDLLIKVVVEQISIRSVFASGEVTSLHF